MTSHIDADIKFLQGMIVHHQQAIVMSKLAGKRTNNKTIIDLANRIDLSQVDEINFMESWLSSRDQNVHEMNHKDHMHMSMSGMATPAQIESLKNSNAHNELDTLDKDECSKCSFCTVANQFFHFNTVIQPQFSLLLLQKKFDSIKSYYSHILKPNGPPPKKII